MKTCLEKKAGVLSAKFWDAETLYNEALYGSRHIGTYFTPIALTKAVSS
jgi:hypothetical protein